MQEKIIGDLIGLLKKTIGEISLNFISKAQENLDFLKNPLSVLDPQSQFENQEQFDNNTAFNENEFLETH